MYIIVNILAAIVIAGITAYKIEQSELFDFNFWKVVKWIFVILVVLWVLTEVLLIFGIDITFIWDMIPFTF